MTYMKPWSKLKRALMDLVDDRVKFDIHQTVYRPQKTGTDQAVPRYYITVDKKIIFDYPKNFPVEAEVLHDRYVQEISSLIREYIDTPLKDVLSKPFHDPLKITDLFKCVDRRLGRQKLNKWSEGKSELVKQILAKRFTQEELKSTDIV